MLMLRARSGEQVDGIIFVLNADDGLNWGPVKQVISDSNVATLWFDACVLGDRVQS